MTKKYCPNIFSSNCQREKSGGFKFRSLTPNLVQLDMSCQHPFHSNATFVTLSLGPHLTCVCEWLGVFVCPKGAGLAVAVGLSDIPVLSYSKPQS